MVNAEVERKLKISTKPVGERWIIGYLLSGYRTRKRASVCAAAKRLGGEDAGTTADSADDACVGGVPKR